MYLCVEAAAEVIIECGERGSSGELHELAGQ